MKQIRVGQHIQHRRIVLDKLPYRLPRLLPFGLQNGLRLLGNLAAAPALFCQKLQALSLAFAGHQLLDIRRAQ